MIPASLISKLAHLRIAVLLDDEHLVVATGDEVVNFVVERKARTRTHVIEPMPLSASVSQRLVHRRPDRSSRSR